jgi:carbon monoxide dehydrogenase subunit G
VTAFTVSNTSAATVEADRGAIWDALTDTELLPRLTPYLRAIDSHGDRWVWHLVRIPVLGMMVSPSFTEVMTFDERSQIAFAHDPAREDESVGVDGSYHLKDAADGTDLRIQLAITVELPFPSLAKPAVHTAMRGVVGVMGHRFSSNLVRHLGRNA